MKVLAAFDSFKGTASARAIGNTLQCALAGHEVVVCPLSDGGEGLLDVLAERFDEVATIDALGRPCVAKLGFCGTEAIVETAQVVGLANVGGALANDPVRADSSGIASVLESALRANPTAIVVGCGGSAITDGGLGLVRGAVDLGLVPIPIPLRVALDVRTCFTEAAIVFGPQKGADEIAVRLLTHRLIALRGWYQRWYGVDLDEHDGTGAAGGLGGALLAIGGALVSGFAEVADRVGLDTYLRDADLVLTGEGRLDATSLEGKVVGGVLERVERMHGHAVVVVGSTDEATARLVQARGHSVLALDEHFGIEQAMARPLDLIGELVASIVASAN